VHGLGQEGFQDEHVKRALNEIVWFSHTMIIYNKVV
jgi:hypothetical protein